MNYSFEYIDIILLAMIAGFIFLRLRGILGKRTGFEGKAPSQLKEVLKAVNKDQLNKIKENFDEEAQKEFLNGAKIGENCLIGANALVTENTVIPDNSMFLGSPGKVVKTLGPEMKDFLLASAVHYVENYKKFKKGMSKDEN